MSRRCLRCSSSPLCRSRPHITRLSIQHWWAQSTIRLAAICQTLGVRWRRQLSPRIQVGDGEQSGGGKPLDCSCIFAYARHGIFRLAFLQSAVTFVDLNHTPPTSQSRSFSRCFFLREYKPRRSKFVIIFKCSACLSLFWRWWPTLSTSSAAAGSRQQFEPPHLPQPPQSTRTF